MSVHTDSTSCRSCYFNGWCHQKKQLNAISLSLHKGEPESVSFKAC